MSDITVDIERIVLTDLGLTSGRVERIRGLIELEIQRMLEQEGLSGEMTDSEISNLSVPMIYLDRINSDVHIATSLARSISQILRRAG